MNNLNIIGPIILTQSQHQLTLLLEHPRVKHHKLTKLTYAIPTLALLFQASFLGTRERKCI